MDFILFFLSTLVECATTYKKKNIWDELDYTDEKISDGVYRVTYEVNEHTSSQDALKYWHQRATELCGSSDYVHDEKLTTHNHQTYNPAIYSYADHISPYVEGTVKCKKN